MSQNDVPKDLDEMDVLESLSSEDVSLTPSLLMPIVSLGYDDGVEPLDHASFYDAHAWVEAEAAASTSRLYPNGAGTVTFAPRVVDQHNRPVPGVAVSFEVQAVNPTGNRWRTADGVVARYGSASQAKVRRKINNGQIRLLGTLAHSSVTTNANGYAENVYTVSHIGGNQSRIAREKVIYRISSGSGELLIDIGYDWLVNISAVAGGLRVVGARGKHIHREINKRLTDLGESVAANKWPHPVTITAGTLRWGGLYPPHFTHRWGAEIDVRPMTTDGNPLAKVNGKWDYESKQYDRPRTQLIVNAFRQLGASTIYFNDPKLKGVSSLAGHYDHLHVSFARKSLDPVTVRAEESLTL